MSHGGGKKTGILTILVGIFFVKDTSNCSDANVVPGTADASCKDDDQYDGNDIEQDATDDDSNQSAFVCTNIDYCNTVIGLQRPIAVLGLQFQLDSKL